MKWAAKKGDRFTSKKLGADTSGTPTVNGTSP